MAISKRFWVGEYDGSGGLFEKLVFWPKFEDKGGGFVVGFDFGNQLVDQRWGIMKEVEHISLHFALIPS